MFCSSCGAKLPDGAKFCFNCGFQMGAKGFQPESSQTGTKLVPAKCTSCGAAVQVDSQQKAAICPFCNTAYIISEAINNYNISVAGNFSVNGTIININGKNMDNLLKRAKQYALSGDFDQALKYYNEVLDSDMNSIQAMDGIQRIKEIINNYVYLAEDTPIGRLELKKDRLILITSVNPQLFELSRIFGLDIVKKGLFSSEKVLQFVYNGIPQKRISVPVNDPNKWFVALEDAKMGKYPYMKNLGKLYERA